MLQRRHLLQLGAAAITLKTKRSLSVYTCIQPGLPKPEFWFGDQVCLEWQCDDKLDLENFGKPLQDYGVVIGLFFSGGSRRYAPGWNYSSSHSYGVRCNSSISIIKISDETLSD